MLAQGSKQGCTWPQGHRLRSRGQRRRGAGRGALVLGSRSHPPLTSTQVSISGNWLMMGSTASIELPARRSDLLPTRMMGTLGRETHGHRGWGSWRGPPPWALPVTWGPSRYPRSPVGSIWCGSEKQGLAVRRGACLPHGSHLELTPKGGGRGPLRDKVTDTGNMPAWRGQQVGPHVILADTPKGPGISSPRHPIPQTSDHPRALWGDRATGAPRGKLRRPGYRPPHPEWLREVS